MVQLRDYQGKGAKELGAAYRNGYNYPLYVLPTGGGKTIFFCWVVSQTVKSGQVVWILVHREELLIQTSQTLSRFGVDHSLVADGFTMNPYAKVQVGMVQTVANRMNRLIDPNLIIIDEAHHAVTSSWMRILRNFPFSRRLGVTATPVRQDGRGLGDMFDVMIQGPTPQDLINMGYLTRPKVIVPPGSVNLDGLKVIKGDFDVNMAAEMVDTKSITGNAVAHYQKYVDGAPAVAFTINIKHAEHVAETFREAGYRAVALDGKTDKNERKRIINALGTGEIQVITSCNIISEGTDIPSIAAAMLLRPTLSEGLFIQQCGRAFRVSPGKEFAYILDHVGNVFRHGRPEADRNWELFPTTEKRKREIGTADNPKVFVCGQCFLAFDPAPVCPYCGHEVPVSKNNRVKISERDGILVELEGEVQTVQQERRRAIRAARTLDELKVLERMFEFKKGWAEIVYQVRLRNEAVKMPNLFDPPDNN